jgi:hypothetical protein
VSGWAEHVCSAQVFVIDLNAEVSDGAFDFCVTEQELYRP